MNRKTAATALVVVVLAVGVGIFLMNRGDEESATTATTPTAATESAKSPAGSSDEKKAVEIVYTPSGFAPKSVTITSGQSVTFKNSSTQTIEPASDPHPTHTGLADLNLGLLKPGESKTVTLAKNGTFGYHDHLNPSDKGTIIVK